MAEVLQVGMAELKVLRSPGKLAAYGIGSCVVLVLWDPGAGLGGMVHSMLPLAQALGAGEKPAKYCDLAVDALLEALAEQGGRPESCRAWLVGGATMFGPVAREGALAPLGERNLLAARASLAARRVSLTAEDCGGTHGRSLELDCLDGSLRVWSAHAASRLL